MDRGPVMRLVEVAVEQPGIQRDALAAACNPGARGGAFGTHRSCGKTAGLLDVHLEGIRPGEALR
jgi:hypothetical protein